MALFRRKQHPEHPGADAGALEAVANAVPGGEELEESELARRLRRPSCLNEAQSQN